MVIFPLSFLALGSVLRTPLAQDPLLGAGVAETLTAANWTPDYRPYRLAIQGASSGNIMGLDFSSLMMMSMMGGGGGGAQPPQFLTDISSVWTKGEKVCIGGQSFLVGYKANVPNMMSMISHAGSGPKKLIMVLDLIRPDMITEIQPVVGLTKEAFLNEGEVAGLAFADSPDASVGSSPVVQEAETREKATATLSNIKQDALALIMYMNDYDDVLPKGNSTAQIEDAAMPYLKTKNTWQTLNPNGGRILFNMALSGVNESAIDMPAEVPLLFEEVAWPDGRRAVAYTDGHAKLEDQQTWALKQKYLHMKFKKLAHAKPAKAKGLKP
jgi:hypothetical protein